MENVTRMRTINQCVNHIKQLDPDTAISEWYLRTLVKENKIKYFMTGNKALISLESLLSFLNFNNEDIADNKECTYV